MGLNNFTTKLVPLFLGFVLSFPLIWERKLEHEKNYSDVWDYEWNGINMIYELGFERWSLEGAMLCGYD
jgi:hypothetical protein